MSNRLITIYEDRTTRLELNDKEKQDIITLKELWGSQNLILQADGSILMKHYVGFYLSEWHPFTDSPQGSCQ